MTNDEKGKQDMSAIGQWNTRMKTPIGSVDVVFTFTNQGGELKGSASSKGEESELRDIVVTRLLEGGETVTWNQAVTKPMRLNLEFDVVVKGDTMVGHSRAGRLPRSVVKGTRA